MLTRCPACQTVFRVSPEQLAARAGRVRCGHCLKAFDALNNAVEGAPVSAKAAPTTAPLPATAEEPGIPAAPEAIAPETEAEPKGMEEEGEEEAATPPMPAVFLGRSETSEQFPPARQEEGESTEAEAQPTEEPVPAEAAEEPSAAAILSGRAAEEEAEGERPAAAVSPAPPALAPSADRRRAWGIALGVLTMTLLLQGLFLLRQPLTQAMPALREPLAALCRTLGCELPLPRNAAEIGIEASDLHPEPGGRGDFVLHATLKNRAPYPQAYPHVELSLTDAADRALVRRVFGPAEWAPDRSPEAAFGPDASAELALPFTAAGVAAVGYRVYAFYP